MAVDPLPLSALLQAPGFAFFEAAMAAPNAPVWLVDHDVAFALLVEPFDLEPPLPRLLVERPLPDPPFDDLLPPLDLLAVPPLVDLPDDLDLDLLDLEERPPPRLPRFLPM